NVRMARSARNRAFLTLYARMTARSVRANEPVREGAISVAPQPAAKSQKPPRATAPSSTATSGNSQIKYWGEKTLPTTMKARIAAPLYRAPPDIPRRTKRARTVRIVAVWRGSASRRRCGDQDVTEAQAA